MQEIPIMFCFDKNYVIPAAVCFYSLLENNIPPPESHYHFKLFVVHNDISPQDQEKLQLTITPFSHFASLEFINANHLLKNIWEQMPQKHHFSHEVLYKLIAPQLFPQYDKIIISDVDAIFLGNVTKSFFDFDCNQDYLIGGVVSNNPEKFFPIPSKGYRSKYQMFLPEELKAIQYGVAGGYLIINLKAWRTKNIEQRAITCLQQNKHRLVQAEQDVLSLVCYPHILKISLAHIVCHTAWKDLGEKWEKFQPNIYTQKEIDEAREHPIQLHYAGANKPWNTPSEPKSEIWFNYLCKTPFLKDYLNTLESIILKKHKQQSLSAKIKRKLQTYLAISKAKFKF